MKRIALAKWQPDQFGLANLGQSDTRNVYATGTGYAPLRGLTALSTTGLSAQAMGAISAQDATGTVGSFAGDATKLYKLNGGTYGDVSKAGGYALGSTERWEFVQYGQRVIAAQIGAPPQYYDLGASALFADLPGSPPQARHIAVVRDFVVLGNTTASPNNVTWSGFNASNNWTAGVNQSDTQLLQGGGWLQGIAGGEVGYIFQERAITRMTYVGAPLYFQFDLVEQARGLAWPGALIQVGALSYYLAQDGFYGFDGTQSVSIGNQKVDAWFAAHLAPNSGNLITVGADPGNKLIFWSFVSTDASDASHPDTLLIYNWAVAEWSYAKLAHEMLYPALTEGWTLEQIGAVYPSIETVPASLDSRVWTGGSAYLAGFNTAHNLAAFEGATLAATLQTGDFEGVPGRRSIITNLRPLSDAGTMTAICRSRERFADAVADTAAAALQANGDIGLLSSGRFHQAQLSVPAAAVWTFANGVDVDAADDGEL
jgi:hypothetical protein